MPFAYDWLGRLFAIDCTRMEEGAPAILMLEPGTGQALQIPCNLISFHENELIEYGEEALAVTFYKQWIENGGDAPMQNQCVGYKKPLFLGGKDVCENVEMVDLDVYWTITAQLIHKVRGLPSGTRIGKVDID